MTQLEFPLRVRDVLKSKGYDYHKTDFTYKMYDSGAIDVYFGGLYSRHKVPLLYIGMFVANQESVEKVVSRVEYYYQKLQGKEQSNDNSNSKSQR